MSRHPTADRPMVDGGPVKILVIKQTSLGDVLHATAILRSIRKAYPTAQLAFLTSTTAADILRYNPRIDELLLFDRYRVKRDWWRHPGWVLRHILETMQVVRREQYDLVVDLQGSWKTVIFLWAARARRRLVKGRWWFAEQFRHPQLHAIQEMEGVLGLAGIAPASRSLEIFVSDSERGAITTRLDELGLAGRKLALFSPMTRWQTKNWPLENFVSLAGKLPDDWFVVLTGSEAQRASLNALTECLSSGRAACLAGQLTLLEFSELVGRADLVVTGDSFPMHLAAAQDRPLVALFGPTDESRVGPLGIGTVVRADVECRRCYRRARCDRRCIEKITVDQVLAAVNRATT